jgi:hypothetical protein
LPYTSYNKLPSILRAKMRLSINARTVVTLDTHSTQYSQILQMQFLELGD